MADDFLSLRWLWRRDRDLPVNRLDGKIDPARIAGPAAAVSYVLTWDGGRAVWQPGADGDHAGTGSPSVQVGGGADASGAASTSIGPNSEASASHATALGFSAIADGVDRATAIGAMAQASGDRSTALGEGAYTPAANSTAVGQAASASGARSIALGNYAASTVDDRAVVAANDLEVKRSSGTGVTSLRLYDSASTVHVVGVSSTGITYDGADIGSGGGGGGGSGARVARSTVATLSHNVDTAVPWDTEIFDDGGFWTSSSDRRLTIPTGLGGIYILTASCWFDANGTGIRQVRFRQNGSTILGWQRIPGSSSAAVVPTASVVCQAVAGDYFELMIYQDSGGALNAGGNVLSLNAGIVRIGA